MSVPFNDLGRHVASMSAELEEAALRVLRSGWFVLGPEVKSFEVELAQWSGANHCVSLASGTDALLLALRALDVGPDSEVITVANAGGYTACATRMLGAKPIYVDIDPVTMTLDPALVAAAITPRTRAIVAVHLYGKMADIESLTAIAAHHNIPLLEDCAQSHGARWRGQMAGTFGIAGCFSFYPTKNLGALGDGGAIITNDPQFANRVRQLRTYGWESKYSIAITQGTNSRLDELQAAFLRVKLRYLEAHNQRRRAIVARYAAGLADLPIHLPQTNDETHVHHLLVVRVPAEKRAALQTGLRDKGIGTDIHYPIPDHHQPAWQAEYSQQTLPITEAYAASILSLPCSPELTDAEVDGVIAAIHEVWAV